MVSVQDVGLLAQYHNRMARRQMNGIRFTIGLALAALAAGCGSARLFTGIALPESPEVAAAPWPRLVDTPEAPPPGSYTADVPDPAQGVAVTVELGEAAREAAGRARALEGPVLGEADRRRLGLTH
jgi:hypothetical protein